MGSLDAKRFHDEEEVAGFSLGWVLTAIQRVMRGCAGELIRTVEDSHS